MPAPLPLRLGNPALDNLVLREPDLALYDQIVPPHMTLDPEAPENK